MTQNSSVSNFQLIQDLLKRPIAFHRIFAKIMGCATGGLFLSQLFYWSVDGKARDPENYIYKTFDEWHVETCLSRREWETSRQKLKSLGLLHERRAGRNPLASAMGSSLSRLQPPRNDSAALAAV